MLFVLGTQVARNSSRNVVLVLQESCTDDLKLQGRPNKREGGRIGVVAKRGNSWTGVSSD